MPIIGTLPNNIQNGQTVDATPVMADFNFIVNQVNANANPTGTLTAPSGTRTVFHQAAAPVGWTIDGSIGDHTIQVNGAGGGAVGGVNGYSTMFNAQWTTDGHAVTLAEMPVHNHADAGHNHGVNDPGHSHRVDGQNVTGGGALTYNGASSPILASTAVNTTGISIQTGFAAIQNSGSGAAHTHTKTFNALFVAMIMAAKT